MPGMKRREVCSSTTVMAEELSRHVACVFEPSDVVEVRRLPSGRSSWHQAGNLAEAARSLSVDNQHGEQVYAGANPRRFRGGTKSEDVMCARCLFADFDRIGFNAARQRWSNAGLPVPTLTIHSGHGIHAYWRLAEPVTDMALWSALQKRLIALLGSDVAIHDPARLMRLPGFINHKKPVADCRIHDADEARVYDLRYLLPRMYCLITESDYAIQYQRAGHAAGQFGKPLCRNGGHIRVAKRIAAKWPSITKGRRNCKAFQNAAYLLKNLGLTEEQAWPFLNRWNCGNRPPLPEPELRRALRNANIYGQHRAENGSPG